VGARAGWHVIYVEFVRPAHEGRQHVYGGKLLCLQGVVERGMFNGRLRKGGVQGIWEGLRHCLKNLGLNSVWRVLKCGQPLVTMLYVK
jgi:hypothetical protein